MAGSQATCCWPSRCSKVGTGFSLCLDFGIDRGGAGIGNHAILIAGAARGSDGPDHFTVHDERNAALNRDRSGEAQEPDTDPTCRHAILKYLRRTTEQRCRFRFPDSNLNARELRIRHSLEINQVPGRVDYGDSHLQTVFLRLDDRGGGGFFGGIGSNRNAVGDHGRSRLRQSSQGDQHKRGN